MNAIERAQQIIRGGQHIVSFSGAGLSAESGVTTFRDAKGAGLWAKFDPVRLASPDGFAADPRTVIDWYNWRRRTIASAAPNAAHKAFASRSDLLHITQNVDDLLERAGAPENRIVHLHGRIGFDRCAAACGFSEPIEMSDPPDCRTCPSCGDGVRPDVVWFGEALPPGPWRQAERACDGCDVILVVGTSAVVYPAAGLIAYAAARGAAVIVVNKGHTDAGGFADVELVGPAGEIIPAILRVE